MPWRPCWWPPPGPRRCAAAACCGRRAEHERHRAYLEARIAAHDTETDYYIQQVFPTCLDYLHAGNDPDEVMRALPRLNPSWRDLPKYQQILLRKVLKIIDDEENLRDSSQRSFVSIARRVQAIVHQQAKELREMEEDHGRNPEVFDDLLRIDHGTALIGRLADSISVLGGGRPGRQWPKPVALYSVLRGAMSRILEYRRIDLKSIAKINIKGIHVEPVIHAAAELLDNATRYSPPTSKVSVTATEVQTGVAIEIEDAGVSLDEQARARIEGILERAQRGVDLQEIGGNPRLGLAVVGRLCTQFSMQVSLRASAYGGVRAVLIVPSEMITDEPGVGLAHGIGATAVPRPSTPFPPRARPRSAAPPAPASPPRPPWSRASRGHRVDRGRPAAAPQPRQDPARPALRRAGRRRARRAGGQGARRGVPRHLGRGRAREEEADRPRTRAVGSTPSGRD
ncbi:hypothetical protein SALBM217S_00099 [Streptomyces griseoloalbus]